MTSDLSSIQNPRRQNVRDFTVQIRHANTDAIVGTGFVVSNYGHIVTCAHVVEMAGVHPDATSKGLQGTEVGVYFPQVLSDEAKARRALVIGCFPQHDDDVVLLQLQDGPAPLSPDQIAVLGRAELSIDNRFRSYGFRRLSEYEAGLADGLIQGTVDAPRGRKVQADPVQLQSSQINQGMSGAAVLDLQRNLVMGVVSETWYPDSSTKDRDTAWAVNARVLSLEPLNLPLQDEPYTSRPAPQPRTDIVAAQAATNPRPGMDLHGAPPSLPESRWAGRVDLLQTLNADWSDPTCHVSELIGFGGEGKSSLARHWLDRLLADPSLPQPDGVFWWNCYDQPSVDALLEAALQYLSGGSIDPRRLTSSNIRAQVIGAMLGARRYLFILDGLEVLQHQEGDAYGLLINTDLREMLAYFAANSFCLLTSRAPLFDLVNYTTFRHHDVDRLSQEDGRALLRKLGVRGPDAALDRMVTEWDGHALTLSLLGGYLVEHYGGDTAHMRDLPAPIANEPRYERVQRVLRRYDMHLSEAERAFLLIFSAFRLPVSQIALKPIFRSRIEDAANTLTVPLAALDDQEFENLLKRLRTYHLLTYDAQTRRYTTHPLIHAYYAERLDEHERSQVQTMHARIKDYYLSIAGETPYHPTLGELVPLIEAVHHACGASAYDEAIDLFWERIYQGESRVLLHKLGAYEMQFALLLDFFPGGDTAQEPLMSDPKAKRVILNEVGICLMSLGRLAEAMPFYERSITIAIGMQDWFNASREYQNVADLHVNRGALVASAGAASLALILARQAQNKGYECYSLAYQGWAAHLRGKVQEATMSFQQAEALQQELGPTEPYQYSIRGVRYAEHLRRVGWVELARSITEANLEICKRNRWLDNESQCHRMLGDLAADADDYQRARQKYDEALIIARGTSRRAILIEALLAQGRFAARQGDGEIARTYLEDAMGYAVTSGYRLYEVDIAIALAWAYRTMGDEPTARAQAERALRLSTEMEYYWGQVDAKEVLTALNGVGS